MFRTLVKLITLPGTDQDKANAVLAVHPLQLSRWLDEMWAQGGLTNALWTAVLLNPGVPLGDPQAISKTRIPEGPSLKGLLSALLSGVSPEPDTAPAIKPSRFAEPVLGTTPPPPVWDHLVYGYLIESTGIFEILGEVVRRYVVGETLPTPSMDTLVWVRSTEELFFRDPPLFGIGGLTSQLRPEARINRRNAYWRMFGLDLPHPIGMGIDGQPWKRDVGETANERFLELWNELLRQVWLGIEHDKNTSGANPTDASYIAYLCQAIGQLLQMRRRGGMLSREEFAYVTMLSWFHLTVEHDTALTVSLNATAGANGNPADRLALIGSRVGISPSRSSRELFELANKLSTLLWLIELGTFNDPSKAEVLFKINVVNPVIAQDMNRIVDLWQSATGERVKDLSVGVRPPAVLPPAQPTRLLPSGTMPTVAAPATNGHRRQPVPRA
jgi:hypothetical protein